MVVRMGKYTKRTNVAFKEQAVTWLSNLDYYDQNVTPYGEFDPFNAQFTFDRLWDVNYGKFTYNNTTYYGWINVSTHTDGFYVYSFTLDGLTTAAYSGCFNSYQFCKYAHISLVDSGGNKLPIRYREDDRVANNPITEIEKIKIHNINHGYYIAVNVYTYNSTHITNAYSTPDVLTYFMTESQFYNFLQSLAHEMGSYDSELVQGFLDKIFKIYVVPKTYVSGSLPTTDEVPLSSLIYAITPPELLPDWEIISFPIPLSSNVPYFNPGNSSGATFTFSSSWNKNFSPSEMLGRITINVPFLGEITFSPSSYGKKYIGNIGYKAFVDYTGASVNIYPIDSGGVIDYNLFATYAFKEVLPGVGSLGNSFYSNLASAAFSTAGAIGSTGLNISGLGAGALAAAQNSEKLFTPSSSKIFGPTGGTPDRPSNIDCYATFYAYEKYNLAAYQSIYGWPCFTTMKLNSSLFNNVDLTGYVQTENCSLPANGLPKSLIEEANRVLDSGAYIGLTNAP